MPTLVRDDTAAVPAKPIDPSPAPGFIPLDRSTQPQTDDTRVQVPDPASAGEVKAEYGFGLTLLIVGGVLTALVLVALFLLVMRRSWGAHHAPVSQRRPSE